MNKESSPGLVGFLFDFTLFLFCIVSFYVAQTDSELTIQLQPPRCQDYRHVPPCPTVGQVLRRESKIWGRSPVHDKWVWQIALHNNFWALRRVSACEESQEVKSAEKMVESDPGGTVRSRPWGLLKVKPRGCPLPRGKQWHCQNVLREPVGCRMRGRQGIMRVRRLVKKLLYLILGRGAQYPHKHGAGDTGC